MNEVIESTIDGLGFVLYSPFAVRKIKEGEDFFSKYLWDAHSAGKMAEECKIVPFCTGVQEITLLESARGFQPMSKN